MLTRSRHRGDDLIAYYESTVLPALFERLDQAFPEFGWRRTSGGWRATDRGFTKSNFGARPERITAWREAPFGFKTFGGDFTTWLTYINQGTHPRGQDFIASLRQLAERARVDTSVFERGERKQTRRPLEERYAEHAHALLMVDEEATRYLVEVRGFTVEEIARSSLGLHDDRALKPRLRKEGFTEVELRKNDLLENNRWWRRRIVLPWRDEAGRIVTWIARSIGDETPKYLYPKGRKKPLLFGLDAALRRRDGRRDLVLVEGLMDVVRFHAMGLTSVAAIGGSGHEMTPRKWAALEALGVRGVTLALDNDDAGRKGTLAALEQLDAAGCEQLEAWVLSPSLLAPHKDPDEWIRANGLEAWQALLDQRRPGAFFRGATLLEGIAPESPQRARHAAVHQCMAYCDALPRTRLELVREDLLTLISTRTGYERESIERLAKVPPDDRALPAFEAVVPRQLARDPRAPHPHQRRAWAALTAHDEQALQANSPLLGLFVMPMGAGKSYTLIRWLIERVVARGEPVVWLTHRVELFERAAREFHRLAAFATGRASLRIRVVSTQHAQPDEIDLEEDDVVVCSMHLLAHHLEAVEAMIARRPWFFVVEEPHQAQTQRLRTLVDAIKQQTPTRLLGVSATPPYTTDEGRRTLYQVFDGVCLHEASLEELISDRYLSQLSVTRVQTRVDAEAGIDERDREQIARTHTLSAAWHARLAAAPGRDEVIVRHLVQGRSRYGRTLIFALNQAHAESLRARLEAAGVEAGVLVDVAEGAQAQTLASVLQGFRASGEGLRVLIDPALVTGSVELPEVETVFITRPTCNEVTLRQMIGSALRGPHSGGTVKAQVVVFEDTWSRYPEWGAPLAMIPELGAAQFEGARALTAQRLLQVIPPVFIERVVRRLQERGIEYSADAFDELPSGWYALVKGEADVDEDSVRYLFVHEHQVPCWNALMGRLSTLPPSAYELLDVEQLDRQCFGDCDAPRPAREDVLAMIDHLQRGHDPPVYTVCEHRQACDPHALASALWTQNIPAQQAAEMIHRHYQYPIAQAIYPSQREYRVAIDDALYELWSQDESTRSVRATPIFLSSASSPPIEHDLEAIWGEVVEGIEQILGGAESARHVKVTWTQRPMCGWSVKAFRHPAPADAETPVTIELRVNRRLASEETSRTLIVFGLWHVFIHGLQNKTEHDREFKTLEEAWPDIEAAREQLAATHDWCCGRLAEAGEG